MKGAILNKLYLHIFFLHFRILQYTFLCQSEIPIIAKYFFFTYRPLSLMDHTTIKSYLNIFLGTNVFTLLSPGMVQCVASCLPQDSLARSAFLLFYTDILPLYVFTLCFALVLREKGWLIGGDRWLFKFGLEPIPPLVLQLKVTGGGRVKGCCSISERYKSQKQTSKKPELWKTDLRPCNVLPSLFHNFYTGVILTYCWYRHFVMDTEKIH